MEIVCTLKTPVNRSKADICYLVQLIEFFHYHFADLARRYLPLAQTKKFLHYTIHRSIHISGRNRTLVQCPHETGQQFFAIELGTVAILFYYLRQAQLNCFIGGKAFITRKTPSAATYSVAFLAHPGVDDACI